MRSCRDGESPAKPRFQMMKAIGTGSRRGIVSKKESKVGVLVDHERGRELKTDKLIVPDAAIEGEDLGVEWCDRGAFVKIRVCRSMPCSRVPLCLRSFKNPESQRIIGKGRRDIFLNRDGGDLEGGPRTVA